MGRAASEVLGRQVGAIPTSAIYKANEPFGGRPISAPGVSTEFSDALLAGANRVITGYFERANGRLSFTAIEEDARTGKTLLSTTVTGPFFQACTALAKQFTASPKPYPTNNETALRDFMQSVESPNPTGSLYEQSVAADPRFADAYLAWAETALSHHDPELMSRILSEARAHNLGSEPMARLDLVAANLNQNSAARLTALRQIVYDDPHDLNALQALGDAELLAHNYPAAAAAFGKGASASRPDLLNSKAYALMYAGDEKGAVAAVDEYRKDRPQDPNAIDSAADIQFYFGRFAEAEKLYLQSAAKDQNFNQGTETWKAARAHLMTGDAAGATTIFNSYRQAREKAQDPAVPFRAACWTFFTGDRPAGIAAMHQVADAASNQGLKILALAQASIWELQLGRKADALRDSSAVLQAGQSSNLIAAAIVRFTALDQASEPDLRTRADRMFTGAAVPLRAAAVAYALYFNGRYAEAAPIWKQIYDQSNPNDQLAGFLLAGSLQQSGHATEAAPLLKPNPLPSPNLAPSFESLYFPDLFNWRGDKTTYLKLSKQSN
jgi:thioredoxin-like negative regulator of GroEL